jgi:type IV pilus assembly protein PilW
MIIQTGIDIMEESGQRTDFHRERGFTLVEIMVALAIASIVVGAMYSTYALQRRTHAVQQATSEMQQNVRAALVMLVGDLNMAGYDPTGAGGFGFKASTIFQRADGALSAAVKTDASNLAFTSDLNENGLLDRDTVNINGDTKGMSEMEQVAYRFNAAENTLQRYSSMNGNNQQWQIVAENIEAIGFNFLNEDGIAITPLSATNVDDIRTVQIAVLARSEGIDRNQNAATYTTPAPWSLTLGTFNDNFQRRMLVTSVKLRNMGLQ